MSIQNSDAVAPEARAVGEEMRAIRQSARVSVEQVEADLRIKAKYIEAMEAGDTGAMPARVYADGYLRNYAHYVGLDPAETVRRFYGGEARTAGPLPVQAPPPRKGSSLDEALAGTGPSRRSGGGRALAAVLALAVVGAGGFGAYHGYAYARDAGWLPAALSGGPSEPVETAAADREAGTQRVAARPDETPEPEVPAAAEEKAEPPKPEVVEVVGDEPASRGARPGQLGYARAGATPYWQAKPPALEPVDGPVDEIARERDAAPEERPSRITDTSRAEATTDADAARIAAEARRALLGALDTPVATPAPADTAQDAARSGEADPLAATAPADVAEAVVTPLDPEAQPLVTLGLTPDEQPVPGIGPVVVADPLLDPVQPAPAQPSQPPRRFALHAVSDTWVQVQDAAGGVAYTGIMSAGETYTIPDQPGLSLKTGNAGGLLIEVAGERFGPLGGTGEVMRRVPLDPASVRSTYRVAGQ